MPTSESSSKRVDRDTSSFVEHLRLVHFTLVATCLVALVAITSQTPSSAARAYDQVNQLIILSDRWRNGDWLLEEIRKNRPPLNQIEFASNSPKAQTFVYGPPPPANGTLSHYWFVLANADGLGATALNRVEPKRFGNLSDTKTAWEMLSSYRYGISLTGVENGWAITLDGKSSEQTPPAVRNVVQDRPEGGLPVL